MKNNAISNSIHINAFCEFIIFTIFILTFTSLSFSQISHSINFRASTLSLTAKLGADNNQYTHVSIPKLELMNEKGKPKLPVKYLKFLLPPNTTVKNVTINGVTKIDKNINNKIFPGQLPEPTSKNSDRKRFVNPDTNVYNSSNPYPASIVQYKGDSYFDGKNHIALIAVYPVQYFPTSDRIEYNTNISFTLNLEGYVSNTSIQPKYRAKRNQEIYDKILKAIIANPEDIPTYQIKPTVIAKASSTGNQQQVQNGVPFYGYVIITTNSMKNSFDEFVNWKRRKGIDIGVVTIEDILANYKSGDLISNINDAAGDLRQYLHDAWDEGNTLYVLLADSLLPNNQHSIPFRYGNGNENMTDNDDDIPNDLYFSNLTASWNVDDDSFYGETSDGDAIFSPNIFVGRLFFANSTEIANWIHKEIEYEQNPFNGNYSNVTSILWSESDQMQDYGEPDAVRASNSYFNNLNHTIVGEEPSADAPATTGPMGTSIINDLNNGYGFYNIYNHGTPYAYTVSDSAYNLRPWRGITRLRTDTPPYIEYDSYDNITANNTSTIVYSIACYVSCPDDTGRSLGDIYTTLGNSGGTAFIGNTRDGFYDFNSSILHEQFVDALYNQGLYNLGITEATSKLDFSGNDYYHHYIKLSNNLYGDPEMPVWTANPTQFNNVTVTDNGSSLTVNTGVSGCTICVSSLDNGSSYYLAVDNVSSYNFPTSIRPLYVTVTNHNYIPYSAITGGTITSNTTIYGQLKILNNLNVNNGVTLTISPDANLVFNNSSSLIISGTLIAHGTSTNNLSFDFVSPSSSTRNGIIVNNNGVENISYATISSAYNGDSINTSSYQSSIQNTTIQNCYDGIAICYSSKDADLSINNNTIKSSTSYGIRITNPGYGMNLEPTISDNNITNGSGIYIYNASPQILSNQIIDPDDNGILVDASGNTPIIKDNTIKKNSNNSSYQNGQGIWVINSSTPYIAHNQVSGFYNGIYIGSSSIARFIGSDTWNQNNLIVNNLNGLVSGWGSSVYAGYQGSGEYNSIHNNAYYDVSSNNSSYLYAEYNWWGGGQPLYYVDGSSVLDTANILPSDPWDGIMPKIQQIKNPSVGDYTTSLSKTIQTITDTGSSNIANGFVLEDEGKIDEAINYYESIIKKGEYINLALTELAHLHNKYSRSGILNYFEGVSAVNKGAMPTRLLADMFLQNGSFDKAIMGYDNVINNYPNSFQAINSMFEKLFAYLNVKGDYEKADQILSKIKAMNLKDNEWMTRINIAENLMGNAAISKPISQKDKNNIENNTNGNTPKEYALYNNYPNPFNPATIIHYEIPNNGLVTLKIYDMLGREIKTLVNQYQNKGKYNIKFDGTNLASGIYIYRLKAGSFISSKKMILLK